jgi:3-methyladenine DNA glycosylase/8-oxoguanine DNA glycosylase
MNSVDVRLSLGALRGPSLRFTAEGTWWATRTPEGPATVLLGLGGARAWGAGSEMALDRVATMFADDPSSFVPRHPFIADAHRRYEGLRIPRTGAVMDALLPAIIEQKVIGRQARESWRRLVWRYSEPAPGPLGRRLWLPPHPVRLAKVPSYALHDLNIEGKRADTLRLACAHAAAIEANPAAMTSLPGIGAWTYAQVALVALGDADAVPVGDYHFKNIVAWNLAGRARGTDDEMLELLEPYRGQRGRALKLILLGGTKPPKYGPRMALQSIAEI